MERIQRALMVKCVDSGIKLFEFQFWLSFSHCNFDSQISSLSEDPLFHFGRMSQSCSYFVVLLREMQVRICLKVRAPHIVLSFLAYFLELSQPIMVPNHSRHWLTQFLEQHHTLSLVHYTTCQIMHLIRFNDSFHSHFLILTSYLGWGIQDSKCKDIKLLF